ncbi:AraC family transcriptional regulator [Gracilimonas mengyeensis]|uniref:AraC-type DNA-binding protein n=1 Tax=Gracilimonas mengyeensis TaxID=1302730 RepID=A0A521D5Z5_9BACT|nr:AraC family transcriptional regulator [Gracilimonas mengyeensis]SMO67114.1 AraC-type DNA-binding protein [Gracilimonas mengyeensis]
MLGHSAEMGLFFYLSVLLIVNTSTLKANDSVQVFDKEKTSESVSSLIERAKGFIPNHPDSLLFVTDQLLNRTEVQGDDSLYTTVKYLEGVGYIYKDYYNMAIESYQEALTTSFAQNSQDFQVRIYNNLGVCHDKLKEHDEALRNYHKALEVEKERGDPAEMADMYINIGLVYHSINKYEQALENFKTAQSLVEGLSVGYTRGLIQQNLGIVYKAMGRFVDSKEATQNAIDIFEEHDIHRSILQSKYNQSINYIDTGEYQQARDIIEEAIEESFTYQVPVQRALLNIQLGRIELLEKNPESAIKYFDVADSTIAQFEETYSSFPMELYESRLEAYAQMGKAEEVMDTFREYEKIREERDIARQTTEINELELQLKVSENLAKMREQTIALQQERTKNRNYIYLSSFLGIVLIGGFIFFRYRDQKLKKLYQVNKRVVTQHKRFYQKTNEADLIAEEAPVEKNSTKPAEENAADIVAEVPENDPQETEDKPDRAERWIFSKINDLMDEKELYKDPNLTLADLSAEAGVSSRAASESINYYSGLSFNHFINEFRVVDAMKALEDESKNHLSLEAVMEDSGFASRSTFYSAFDKVSGMTPNQYRKMSQRA